MIEKLVSHRGGCIIYTDYSGLMDNEDYFKTLSNWLKVSHIVTKKLRDLESEGIQPENIFMYGFSLGARIVIDSAIRFGKRKIGMIDGEKFHTKVKSCS